MVTFPYEWEIKIIFSGSCAPFMLRNLPIIKYSSETSLKSLRRISLNFVETKGISFMMTSQFWWYLYDIEFLLFSWFSFPIGRKWQYWHRNVDYMLLRYRIYIVIIVITCISLMSTSSTSQCIFWRYCWHTFRRFKVTPHKAINLLKALITCYNKYIILRKKNDISGKYVCAFSL